MSLEEASEAQESVDLLQQSASQSTLMATQEVENYLERINKQREALSQWERSRSHEHMGLAEILGTQRKESQTQEDDADMLTQMPMSASALESPDLLASFQLSSRRRSLQVEPNDADSDDDRRRRLGSKAKRQVQLSPPPLYPQTPSPSRKRVRVPSPQNKEQLSNGDGKPRASRLVVEISSDDSDDDVPDSQPNASEGDEAIPESVDNSSADKSDDSDFEVPATQPGSRLEEPGDSEEEYEMKPAVPLPPTPEETAPRHGEGLRHLFAKSNQRNRRSDDFRSAITAFQAQEKHQHEAKSLAARHLSASAHAIPVGSAIKESAASKPAAPNAPPKPPMHTAKSVRARASDSTFVFVSSDLAREEIKRVMEACQQLGGKFGQDFDLRRDPASGNFYTSVTHLITKAAAPIDVETNPNELRCKRTAKYMRALAEGTFVMDFSWVATSLAAGRWLTEEPFEMVGDIYSDSVGKPREARIRRKQTGRRNSIFSMFCFVLLVSESEFDFQFASVRHLVNNFGGRVMHSDEFERLSSKQRARRTPVGMVSKITTPHDAKAKWQRYHIPIVRITWIFDSVSHLEVLPFDDYYPY